MARVLIMEDDDSLRPVLRAALERAGYEVADAADGEAGLQLYREFGADLVLVDVFMPVRDGLEVIAALRGESPHVKIVAMSGESRVGQADMLQVAAALGAACTLRKPFQARELLRVIREVLGSCASDDVGGI
ncbi:MAG TPA: response regulator [Gemmatimonadales bacterium]